MFSPSRRVFLNGFLLVWGALAAAPALATPADNLCAAAQSGDLAQAQSAVAQGASVNTMCGRVTATARAMDFNASNVAKYLAQNGANGSALNETIARWGHPHHYSTIELAINKGDVEVVISLLKSGTDPNVSTFAGSSLLARAFSNPSATNRRPLVAALLANGADRYKVSFSPSSNVATATYLSSLISDSIFTTQEILTELGTWDFSKDTLGATNTLNIALHSNRDLEVLDGLVQAGAKLSSSPDGYGVMRNPLTFYIGDTYRSVFRPDIADWLIARVDIHEQGDLPLFRAILAGRVPETLYLLKKGADANAFSDLVGSPLHQSPLMAVSRCNGYNADLNSLVTALIKNGARLEARDANGNTALLHSLNGSGTVLPNLLLDAGASVKIRNNQGEGPLCFLTYASDQYASQEQKSLRWRVWNLGGYYGSCPQNPSL